MRVAAALRQRHMRVAVGRLAVASSNWSTVVNQPDADTLVITVSEAVILAHGIPINLAPVLLYEGDRRALRQGFPMTCRTVEHAKGRLGALPSGAARTRPVASDVLSR